MIPVDMSAEEAATLIMSAGVVQPGSDPQKKIAALAATALAAKKVREPGEPESAFSRRRVTKA
ncbi:hypothetical protein LAZ29_00080, partial [Cereibacter sphaeroides]|nr:hypothetical protein [Cereibacter sphaeroides]